MSCTFAPVGPTRRANMSIITVSRGSYSYGKEVAERVAERLGYECVAREILLEASKEFDIPQIKLDRIMGDTPSFIERFTKGREKYIAYIEAAVLMHLQRDNVVYHGMAGHFFLRGISHVLKVRVIAHAEARARVLMERDALSRQEALKMVKQLDLIRRKWSKQLYGIDTWDSSLYDLIINIERIGVEEAVDMICETVASRPFRTTPESQGKIDRRVRAAQARLHEIDPSLAEPRA
jgi:cytidylate kinase